MDVATLPELTRDAVAWPRFRLPRVTNIRDTSVFDFAAGPIEPCHIVITPGASGRANLSCHLEA